MLRRLVDASIPALCAVGFIPAAVQATRLPLSVKVFLGPELGKLWALALGLAFLAVCTGIMLRRRKPETAFRWEFPALIFAAFVSTIYGTAIWWFRGLEGWTPAWCIYGIGANCFFRFLELNHARHIAAKEVKANGAHG